MDARTPKANRLRVGRHSENGRIYLITAVTFERSPIFTDFHAARLLIDTMRQHHERGHVDSLAFVVMPDHLHWLFELRSGTLSGLVRDLKAFSARAINAHFSMAGRLWQAGFHDHALRREEDLRSAARYVVFNPVRAGLVERVADYPHWDAKWL